MKPCIDEHWMVRAQGKINVDCFIFMDRNMGQCIDNFSMKLFGSCLLKAFKLITEKVVKSVGDDGEDDAKVANYASVEQVCSPGVESLTKLSSAKIQVRASAADS